MPQYRLEQIRAPIALFVGEADELPDSEWIVGCCKARASSDTFVRRIAEYEHLDLLWADNGDVVNADVIRLLNEANDVAVVAPATVAVAS